MPLTEVPSSVAYSLAVATGLSLTGFTVMETVAESEPPLLSLIV